MPTTCEFVLLHNDLVTTATPPHGSGAIAMHRGLQDLVSEKVEQPTTAPLNRLPPARGGVPTRFTMPYPAGR
jgi:hypothetical protein